MAENTTNIINQSILSIYHIDQQIEQKEENEREEENRIPRRYGIIVGKHDYNHYYYDDVIFDDEKEKTNNDPILSKFDDKTLNEMTLIYDIGNNEKIRL